MDQRGKVVQDPQVSLMGLGGEGDNGLAGDIAAVIHDAIDAMPKSSRTDDAAVRHTIAQAGKRFLNETHGKKPLLEVHLVRV